MKAILVDDNPNLLALLSCLFQSMGHEVVSFSNPKECLQYSCNGCKNQSGTACPCIVMSDYEMPHINGVEFIEALRGKGCKCPNIALMSGSSIPNEVMVRASSLGVKFFAKPFHRDQINDWLNHNQHSNGQSHHGSSFSSEEDHSPQP